MTPEKRAAAAYARVWDEQRAQDGATVEKVAAAVVEALGVEPAAALLAKALANNPVSRETVTAAYAVLKGLQGPEEPEVDGDATWECYVDVSCHLKHGDDEDPYRFATKPIAASREAAAASTLREFADYLEPISGAAHDEQRFLFALDRRRAAIMREHAGAPNTRALLLRELDALAGAFGVEWYGVRG